MEKQRNLDGQNFKAQLDAIHDVLDTKADSLSISILQTQSKFFFL